MDSHAQFVGCLIFWAFVCAACGSPLNEPLEGDCNRFVYEYKLMERLVLMEQENKRLTERMDKLEDKSIKDSKPTAVAVTVRLSGNQDLATNKRVKYDVVTSNVGEAFDLLQGQFVTPVNGIYMIVVQACLGNDAQWMELDVVKDGAKVGHVFTGDRVYHNCGSEAVSLSLNVGDAIWVERAVGSATVLTQDHGWNSFTAVLVQPIV